jgi:nucleotide-binding universal stress UspA family protein
MPKKILLPVDGSDHAHKAAALAGDLAEKYDGEIVLLHVIQSHEVGEQERHMAEVEHVTDSDPGSFPWVTNVPAELVKVMNTAATAHHDENVLKFISEKIVHDTSEILKRHGAAPKRVLFKNGNPAERILETVEEEEIDTVVMGSRGMSDLKGLVAGSVSHKVGQLAGCTCITVK